MSKEQECWAEQLVFDANLKEFAHRVEIIVGLEQGKKLSRADAYAQIKALWKSLKLSKKNLQIGPESEPPEP